MHWVIDTDAGVDDAIGLVMPFVEGRYPNFKLLAITTVSGNVPLERVNVNVGAVLDLVDASLPFFAGCARPMLQPLVHAADFHGADGLGDAGLSHTQRKPEAMHAALALCRFAQEHRGDLGVITLGPLTNLALACNLDPDLPQRVAQVVVMGGAWQGRGNQTPAAEFNIAVDPESARVVFERFPRITLLPWEVSLEQMMPFEMLEAIASADTKRARFFAAMTRIAYTWRDRFGFRGVPLPDPLAVAVALDERVIAEALHARVRVDIGHDVGRGFTALDRRSETPNTRVVTRVDAQRAWAMIAEAWSR
ncbi:MAG: nucleoside hydrolase [Anaerolineae bacterium]|nr:nucleoside hydrolase [Thermoflexales bacterium]MCX7938820.1 nucleoside hydrolase [Thermoflexales bacterium]MDW8054879.1 nucleoside hydrolase [Anaerolineae bacterium]MDW8293175.1 nucleoside hydrolase [Anaerolineae bacterium]